MSLRARDACSASVQELPHHRSRFISHIPSEVRGGACNGSWNLGSPSRRSNALTPAALTTSLTERSLTHICQRFQVLRRLSSPQSSKEPPERGDRRKEGEGALIWWWSTVQFATVQWNSIDLLVNIHLESLCRRCPPLVLSHLCSPSDCNRKC